MPLVTSKIETEIRKINDKDFAQFEGFPADYPETEKRWAKAVYTYAQDVVPASTLHADAKADFESTLGQAQGPADYKALLPAAFAAYAAKIASSMPGFTGTPPAAPVDFAPVAAIGFAGGSGSACSKAMAGIIDAWFRTGTATNNNTGATVNWN